MPPTPPTITYTRPAQASHPETPPPSSCSCRFCLCGGDSARSCLCRPGRGGDESQEPWTCRVPESTPWPHCSKPRDLECVPRLPWGPGSECSGEPGTSCPLCEAWCTVSVSPSPSLHSPWDGCPRQLVHLTSSPSLTQGLGRSRCRVL